MPEHVSVLTLDLRRRAGRSGAAARSRASSSAARAVPRRQVRDSRREVRRCRASRNRPRVQREIRRETLWCRAGPGRAIWPPWVWPASASGKPSRAACANQLGRWISSTRARSAGISAASRSSASCVESRSFQPRPGSSTPASAKRAAVDLDRGPGVAQQSDRGEALEPARDRVRAGVDVVIAEHRVDAERALRAPRARGSPLRCSADRSRRCRR